MSRWLAFHLGYLRIVWNIGLVLAAIQYSARLPDHAHARLMELILTGKLVLFEPCNSRISVCVNSSDSFAALTLPAIDGYKDK